VMTPVDHKRIIDNRLWIMELVNDGTKSWNKPFVIVRDPFSLDVKSF
jgi:hypothetical protein